MADESVGVYADVLNDWLFETMNSDVCKVIWLDDGRWLLADCEGPALFVISIQSAELVAK